MTVSRETLANDADVSRETLEKLDALSRLILSWNRKIGLVSRADERCIWQRHIADSLQLAALVRAGTTSALDLGSGAGFPGLVLALATGIPFILVDSDTRKAAFLLEAIRLTQAPARVLNARIEAVRLPLVDLITARALAPLARLLELATPHLAPDGMLLFLKGASAESEIAEASAAWTMQVDRRISTTGHGVVLQITGIARA